jgi:hypothetical protein
MRKSLSDILHGNGDDFNNRWNDTQAAGDFEPLPPGDYVCLAEAGELFNSGKRGTPGYKLTFRVVEGDHKSRKLWHDCWLTDAAIAQSKRDLGKLGITSLEQLEESLPPGIVCRVRVTLRTDDDGAQRNAVKRFDVLRIETPEADPYTPGELPPSTEQAEGGDK